MSRAVLWSLLLLASGLVAVLGYQLSQIRALLAASYEVASHPQPGSWVATQQARTLDNRSVELAPPGRVQVLYFFTPECPFCQESASEVRALHERLGETHPEVEFAGIGGGDQRLLSVEAMKRGFGFPIARLTPKVADLFKARQVPLLLVVGPDGQIRYSRVGVYRNKEEATSLMAALVRMDATPAAK